uniref:Uncharacterized protein n=2 Tax=Candidatus Kentrum sp. TUN TaxID=2126343 RepID=A0A451B2W2_9GAMM|nr:MAG: hypothetical protein BECKTUN1418E_GA0071001_14562 [Candidatus Kentron sp. TUN]
MPKNGYNWWHIRNQLRNQPPKIDLHSFAKHRVYEDYLMHYRCLSTKLSGDVHDYLQTFCSLARISLGGLSHTSFTGFQFLVLPDQRCGFLTLAVS